MSIQLIFNDDTSVSFWKMNMHQIMHAHRPIHFCAAFRYFDMSPVLKWRYVSMV